MRTNAQGNATNERSGISTLPVSVIRFLSASWAGRGAAGGRGRGDMRIPCHATPYRNTIMQHVVNTIVYSSAHTQNQTQRQSPVRKRYRSEIEWQEHVGRQPMGYRRRAREGARSWEGESKVYERRESRRTCTIMPVIMSFSMISSARGRGGTSIRPGSA
jgi:hypothetical protein